MNLWALRWPGTRPDTRRGSVNLQRFDEPRRGRKTKSRSVNLWALRWPGTRPDTRRGSVNLQRFDEPRVGRIRGAAARIRGVPMSRDAA